MKKSTKIILSVLGIGIVAVPSFLLVRRKIKIASRVSKTGDFVNIKFKTIGSIKLSLDTSSVDIFIDIINNNPYAINISNISSDILVNGKKIGYTQYKDLRIINPNQTQTLGFNVKFNTMDLLKVFTDIEVDLKDLVELKKIKDKILDKIRGAKINGQGKYDVYIKYKGSTFDLKEVPFSF